MSPGPRGRVAGAVGSWRAALRIAGREARRARGRTALVLAMITLPVLALTFTAVSYDMSELTRAERVDRRLGDADAELRWMTEDPLVQDAWGDDWFPRRGDSVPRTRPVRADEVTALLPAGSRVAQVRWWVPFEARIGDRDETFSGRALDLTDPLARARARLLEGRAPAGPTEIAASPVALRRLDARPGDRITVADGSRTYTLVGVVEFPDDLQAVVALHPTAVTDLGQQPETSWLVDLAGPLDAGLADRLNDRGILVAGRSPLPHALSGPASGRMPSPGAEELGNAVLVGGLGLLEVVLLVGPAFAVGVRRRRRDLALVAVAGGDAVHLRRIVLADGVVLGCVGAATGLVLGTAAAFAGRPLVEQYVLHARAGGYRCFPAALAAIAAIAVLAGVLAALAPAWTAARQDVVAGLAGRRTAPPHRRRWLVIAVALTAAGTALAASGAGRSSQTLVLAGLVLGELGLVFGTPTLIGLLAHLGRVLPLAPRIALRDASRNRSSAAPAISAVMAAVAGSVALGVYVASDETRSAQMYEPALPYGHVLVTRPDPAADPADPPTLAQILEPARAHLGADAVAPFDHAACAPPTDLDVYCWVNPVLPPEQACPYQPGDLLTDRDRRRARADVRCRQRTDDLYGTYFHVVVDDGTALPILTGADPADTAAATAVLRAGGAVVTDPRYLMDGRLTIGVNRPGQDPETSATAAVTVAGYALETGLLPDRLVLSRAAADRLGLLTSHGGWAISTAGVPDQRQQDRFTAELKELGSWQVEVERGRTTTDDDPYLLLLAIGSGVITVGAAGIATGLAAAEGRADLSTLAAVGASPRVRRVLSLCQAGVIAVVGSVLGIVAGLGSATIILASMNRRYAQTWPVEPPYPVVVPWQTLGVLVVVPLVAMLGAGLFTRSRLAVERRWE